MRDKSDWVQDMRDLIGLVGDVKGEGTGWINRKLGIGFLDFLQKRESKSIRNGVSTLI